MNGQAGGMDWGAILQMLGAVGSDILSDSGGKNTLGAMTQQLGAKNMQNLLQQMLAGGGKMTADSSGMKLNLPASFMSQALGGTEKGGVWEGLASPWNPQGPSSSQGGGSLASNPFGTQAPTEAEPSKGYTGSLAGLSADDIAKVVQLKMAQDKLAFEREQLANETPSKILDMMYKGQLMQESASRIEAAKEEEERKKPVFTIPGTDISLNAKEYLDYKKMTNETKSALIKDYEYAVKNQGYEGSLIDFKNEEETTHQKEYKEAVKGGYGGSFNDWLVAMRKAGATNIDLSTKLAETKAKAELGGQLYFEDPKWTKDVDTKVDAFNKDQAWLIEEKDRPLATAKVKIRAIEEKIIAGGGQVQGVNWGEDGKTMIWKVKWPSGDVKEIRYAVRP